ncbi:MAG: CoA pyrophosphatase, partial [Alphaproteobacteria bacterium]
MRELLLDVFDGPAGGADPDIAWPAASHDDDGSPFSSAAVLVPLVAHPDGMTVLLTQRTETLRAHAGQISFPGGRFAPGDVTPEDTALRETEEEIGVARQHVELIGRLTEHETGTGYRVVPVVGLLSPPVAVTVDPSEVDHAFEVPLDFV